jgi:hypothetical protein
MTVGECMRPKFSLMAALAALAAAVAFATPASAQEEFAVERTASFDLQAAGKVKGSCKGEVWAGRTPSGSVQATTTVRCPGERRQLQTHISIYGPGENGLQFDQDSACEFCGSYSVAASEQGGPDWCAFGVADEVHMVSVAINYSGSARVCV